MNISLPDGTVIYVTLEEYLDIPETDNAIKEWYQNKLMDSSGKYWINNPFTPLKDLDLTDFDIEEIE